MSETTVFFDISMTVTSPCCGTTYDLENGDSEYWVKKFKAWINNEKDADKINKEFHCDICESKFFAKTIAR